MFLIEPSKTFALTDNEIDSYFQLPYFKEGQPYERVPYEKPQTFLFRKIMKEQLALSYLLNKILQPQEITNKFIKLFSCLKIDTRYSCLTPHYGAFSRGRVLRFLRTRLLLILYQALLNVFTIIKAVVKWNYARRRELLDLEQTIRSNFLKIIYDSV